MIATASQIMSIVQRMFLFICDATMGVKSNLFFPLLFVYMIESCDTFSGRCTYRILTFHFPPSV
jgi:hypothetical protein